jgi:hypothetical protein
MFVVFWAKVLVSTLEASWDKSKVCVPAKMAARSWEKVFCKEMQNLYSSTGSTPMREQAKKPLKMLKKVTFIIQQSTVVTLLKISVVLLQKKISPKLQVFTLFLQVAVNQHTSQTSHATQHHSAQATVL